MSRHMIQFTLCLALSLLGVWLFMGYFLPIGLPFLLGISLAFGAEPTVQLLGRRLRLSRRWASPLGVSGLCLLAATVLICLLALLVRQSQQVVHWLPALANTVTDALKQLQQLTQNLSGRLPPALRPLLESFSENFLQNGGSLLEQAAGQLPKVVTSLIAFLSRGMLGLLTGIISAYMISARMPGIRAWWQTHQPPEWNRRWRPVLVTLKKSVLSMLLSEAKLALLAFGIMAAGFWLLGLKRWCAAAIWIAIVDAFPILGVGTVLLPWSVLCFLRQQAVRGIGILAIYAVVWLTRSILEPKLIGKGLGLDPLATLASIYAGWKLWGIAGMLLAPIMAMTVTQVLKQLKS